MRGALQKLRALQVLGPDPNRSRRLTTRDESRNQDVVCDLFAERLFATITEHPKPKSTSRLFDRRLERAEPASGSYREVFEEEGALDKLEAFASLNGPKHYRMPPNEETITLEKTPWTAPQEVKVAGPDERALVYRGGETIEWKVVA